MTRTCCSPSDAEKRGGSPQNALPKGPDLSNSGVAIPGGVALLGTNAPRITDDGESPMRQKRLKPFRIGATTVTNADFARFIAATGYTSDADRFGWSFVFYSDVPTSAAPSQGVAGAEWWRRIEGANWQLPQGPGGVHADDIGYHPVVHMSWNDATAYARWVGGRLPSEAEWEHAARGGQGDTPFPWGTDAPDDDTVLPCNIWQGTFPEHNTAADGYKTTAPVRAFEPNAYGLYNMVGNVWEWTADPYRVKSLKKSVRQRLSTMAGFKVNKGGSFLCHRSYCFRYRIAARSGSSPDSTAAHQGIRVVWD